MHEYIVNRCYYATSMCNKVVQRYKNMLSSPQMLFKIITFAVK